MALLESLHSRDFELFKAASPYCLRFLKAALKEGICSKRSYPGYRDIALITIGMTSGEMGELQSAVHRETSGIL
jgi:hypothetical protein